MLQCVCEHWAFFKCKIVLLVNLCYHRIIDVRANRFTNTRSFYEHWKPKTIDLTIKLSMHSVLRKRIISSFHSHAWLVLCCDALSYIESIEWKNSIAESRNLHGIRIFTQNKQAVWGLPSTRDEHKKWQCKHILKMSAETERSIFGLVPSFNAK